jgi:hypothetical protein
MPDLAPGIQMQISTIVEAEHVTPDVIRLLGEAMAELQGVSRAKSEIPRDGCQRLKKCGHFRGGCPNLAHCGTYAPPGTPTV